MNRWRLFVCGLVSGLVLAGSLGFVRLATNAPATDGGAPAAVFAVPGSEPTPPEDGKLRVIAFGAHPDDCEWYAGGTGCLWSDLGHHVKFVSATNGDIGHFQMAGGPLAKRRAAEVQAAAKIIGNTAQVLDNHDGELMPTLENRKTFMRLIRNWNADIVISHRPNDYHPDHRYTGVLVQDCAYMVGVPFFCPDTKPLKKNAVFLFACDGFQRPNPFRPDIVVSIDAVHARKMAALAELVSQTIEGGCDGNARMIARDAADLKARQERFCKGGDESRGIANRFRNKLIEVYGEEAGKQIRFAEAFEICEYGRRPTADELRKLFPFVPPKKQ